MCDVEGCDRPAAPRSRLCWAHLRRRQEQRQLDAPIRAVGQTPLQRVLAAVDAYMGADSEDDRAFERARWRLLAALKAYRKAGRTPRSKTAELGRCRRQRGTTSN